MKKKSHYYLKIIKKQAHLENNQNLAEAILLFSRDETKIAKPNFITWAIH